MAKSIEVNASKRYKIIIGSGVLERIGAEMHSIGLCGKAVIVSDDNVAPFFAERVRTALESSGYSTSEFTFSAGEKSKNAQTYLSLLNFMAGEKITRYDTVIALGGGVVGDLAGFAAATYMRGINFVQLPSTILAAVDSSVGGKTAIDLPSGKNLVGAFLQPDLVLCDTTLLTTLPPYFYADGMAEVIKYAFLRDGLCNKLLHTKGFISEIIIAECIDIKRCYVVSDEKDLGARHVLNFGHTLGHAIEKCSDFEITHGHAVALGMAAITRGAVKRGLCEQSVFETLLNLLERYSLPSICQFKANELALAAVSDKKRKGDTVSLIVPERIGSCREIHLSSEDFSDFVCDCVSGNR